MLQIVYAALLLNKLKKPINQLSMTKVLKAAGATYDVEDVIKMVDSLQGTTIEELMIKTFTQEVKEIIKPEPIEEDTEPTTGLFDLFG